MRREVLVKLVLNVQNRGFPRIIYRRLVLNYFILALRKFLGKLSCTSIDFRNLDKFKAYSQFVNRLQFHFGSYNPPPPFDIVSIVLIYS